MVLMVTSLKQIREDLGATQEQIARRTQSVNLRTYIRAEQGKTSVRYDTAMQILEAINGLLTDAGRSPVILEDLGLKIF
jgi:transcriptional regulator with XRE-family HTH domain